VRRLAAATVVRAMGSPVAEVENGAMLLSEVTEVVRLWQQPVKIVPVKLPLPVGVVPVRIVLEAGHGLTPGGLLPVGIRR
jgi:hypothetical protein